MPKWTKQALLVLQANRVPIIWGKPGMGKTDMIVNEIHKSRHGDAPCVVVSPALEDPTTAVGVLAVVADKAVRLLPDAMKPLFDKGRGTLFIDEVTTGTHATQAAFLKLTANRYIGDQKIPDGVDIILAANPADIAAGGSELVVPLANRLVHIQADAPSANEWGDWLVEEMGADEIGTHAAILFASYVRSNPGSLHAMPDDESKRAAAWASPRTMHAAALIYAESLRQNDHLIGLDVIEGCVGHAIGKEIVRFIRESDIPKATDILSGKLDWSPDAKPDVTLAVLRGLAAESTRKIKLPEGMTVAQVRTERGRKVELAWRYFRRAIERGQSEMAYVAAPPLISWRTREAKDAGFAERFADEGWCLDRFNGLATKSAEMRSK